MTTKTLRSEAEWRTLGRFVKHRATPYMRCQESGDPLYHENQTFLPGEHPYHIPNYPKGDTT